MKSETLHWLVLNSASGSNDDEAVAALKEAFAGVGASPARIVDVQAEDCPDARSLAAAGVGLLSVFGGDGTVNAALTGAEGWAGDVLVLPGGTANLLSRVLHGQRGPAEIAASLPGLHRIRRQSIRCSQGRALIEILAGPGAVWSDVREGLREGDLVEVAASGAEAVRQSIAGPMVHLSEPPVGRDAGYAGLRLVPEAGHMAVTGYGAETFSDYLLQGVALLRRDYREGPHDALGRHREALCRSSDGEPIALMIDGERRTGDAAERFSLAELAVNLLAASG